MKILLLVLMALCSLNANGSDCVVLLHGMARSESSMAKLANRLLQEGFGVVNYGYPSTRLTIAEIATEHVPKAIAQCGEHDTVDFVTHSLGGIVLRMYLNQTLPDNLGRVVMLGPPNKGSEVVDKLKNFPGFTLINGPAGLELGTGEDSVPNKLGPVTYPVGIIAGSSTFNPILSQMLPNPDDGKVSVANTKVEGMSDHIVLPVTHTFMMKNSIVMDQVITFLKTGKFKHASER